MIFKRSLFAGALIVAAALGGCATMQVPSAGGSVTVIPSNPEVGKQIAAVQAVAVSVCKFLPTAQTVSAILATVVPVTAPGVGIANQVANAICNAVTPKAGKHRVKRGAPTLNGVTIKGSFVR